MQQMSKIYNNKESVNKIVSQNIASISYFLCNFLMLRFFFFKYRQNIFDTKQKAFLFWIAIH